MTRLWLSRARLRRDSAATMALARLLVPEGGTGVRTAASHRLVWALFADQPDRRRDFLWREEGPGRFMTLSSRPSAQINDLFEIEIKPFEPLLQIGDRLQFSLRANAVVSRPLQKGQRGKRSDVVMDAIHKLPPEARAAERATAIGAAGRTWLRRQGETHGFRIDGECGVDGYEQMRIPRDGQKPAQFSQLDFTGVLTVMDVAALLTAIETGIGRARAFGCGLLLIRRA